MPTIQEPTLCLCGCGLSPSTGRQFAQGHDMRYRGQCLERISGGDPTGADDMEQHIPGHAALYDMVCLRDKTGQKRAMLRQCFRG